jgi:cation diffusion facilitator CzcD-associated flavoprotein CzcO
MTTLETDYLVIGAGAAGMAFTDELIADSEADVVMVDRRHRPGGHWNDAYPFVRLHQPAPFYGVNSRRLGTDVVDTTGANAGWYPRSSAGEICDYFGRVLDETLLPSGRVRFFGMCDYLGEKRGEHLFVSRLTGDETRVRVRRRVVDATYLETPIPATHVPSFDIDPDARFIPVNDLVTISEPARGYTVIGAGKTAMDACSWLLDHGVEPDAIRWIRPRDAWMLDRAHAQPLDLVTAIIEDVAAQLEAAADAESVGDLFARLEANGHLIRLDERVEPTMYRCATVSTSELEQLRSIENVVRRGRVRAIGTDEIVLEAGTIPTDVAQVHVDCTAAGLRVSPARPIFEDDRITLQQVRICQPTFNAALVGYIEASDRDDAERNRLCPPNPYPTAARDWIGGTLISMSAQAAWNSDVDMLTWLSGTRLNAVSAMNDHLGEPEMQSALGRYANNLEAGLANLEKLAATP